MLFRRILLCVSVGSSILASGPRILSAQTTWYVDDDAPGDPAPGDPSSSDPSEDGTQTHPFDTIQEAIDRAAGGDTILLVEGVYPQVA